jgi:hypothetical protein
MKKMWLLIVFVGVVIVSAGLIGCQKKDKPVEKEAVETITEEDAPPVEHPADVKPKDHPKDHPAH